MRSNKWKMLIALCAMVCLLTACGKGGVSVEPEIKHETTFTASEENLVYIEFGESFSPDVFRASLTPIDPQGGNISLSYSDSINGCMMTLDNGAYCLRMENGGDDVRERYFVVDEKHSYYHIRFTPRVNWWGMD